MKYIRFYIREIARFRWAYVLVLTCQLLMVALSLTYVWLSKRIVDEAVLQSAKRSAGLECGWDNLAVCAVLFAVLALLRPSIVAVKSYFQSRISVNMANDLRLRLFDRLLHLKGGYLRKYHSGDMLNRLQVDVSSIASTFCSSVPDLFWAVLQFLAAFAYLLVIDARLAWILVLIIPLAVFGGRYVMFKVRELTLDIRRSDSEVQSHIQESVQHLSLLQTLEYTGNSSDSLGELQADNFSKNMKRTKFSVAAHALVAFSFTVGYAVAFLWGAFGIAAGTVTYGVMTAILQLVGQVQRPLVQASDRLPSLLHCTASIDRLEEIMALPCENGSERHFLEGVAGIRLDRLSFRYPDGSSDVLSDLSFDFAPGSKTAVVGPTGIGKSTLIRLMLSLLSPTGGSVSIYSAPEPASVPESDSESVPESDSESVPESDSESVRESGSASSSASSRTVSGSAPNLIPVSEATRCNLVYVPQGNTLFSGTVRENLQMGDPHATEARMAEVLHTAAADFVLELPKGLDTPCFEQGGGLSEGQAQRIAIARALLRPGSILLLDEFSSALDGDTEDLLLSRLTSALPGRTMIFITHRDRVIDYCDSVLRL